MGKKTVKGLVLEKAGKNVILLTRDGEFLKVPAGERSYSAGMEVEVNLLPERKRPLVLTAASIAAALFIAVALYLVQPSPATPEAYLALDINPGIVLSLDKNAVVIEAESTNEDGDRIVEFVEVEGADLFEVLDALLDAAYKNNYLSAGRDNIVIVSLAAPQNFGITEKDLRASISKKLLKLEVDTYLRITVTGLEKVQAAERRGISLNALLLGEEMKEMMKAEEGYSLLEGSPPLPVREFLQTIDPSEIFGKDEFIAGEDRKDEIKPGIPSPPPDTPGLPIEREDQEAEREPVDDAADDKPPGIPKPPHPEAEQEVPVNLNGGTPAP